MSNNRNNHEEILYLCESISRDINGELSNDEGTQHAPGSVSWEDVIIHMDSLGYSVEMVDHEHAPELIEDIGKYIKHPIVDVLYKASQATSFLQIWCIDGYKLTVHTWSTWHDGPYEGDFQPFWEWAGETAKFREQMRETHQPTKC